MDGRIENADQRDTDEVLRLLRANALPTEGLTEHHATTLVVRRNGHVIGSAALEVYPEGALLRSVAVSPPLQGSGLGRRLTDAAIRLARDLGAPAMYLLTTTAEQYFPRFGFKRIDREQVPPSVRASVEFTSACPATATVMRKLL